MARFMRLALALSAALSAMVVGVGVQRTTAHSESWTTFTSSEFGFAVDYPAGWVADPTNTAVSENGMSQGFSSASVDPIVGGPLGMAPGAVYLQFTVETPASGTTLDDWLRQRTPVPTNITRLPNRDLAGMPNVVFINDFTQIPAGEPGISLNLVVQQGGRIYEVMCTTATRDDFSRWRSSCEAIIDSFRFIMRFFPETGHWVGHGFLAYWQQFGGLTVFGYPLTDEIQENGLTVQYFERARFEWHPGAAPARYNVLLGLLGDEVAATLQQRPAFQPAEQVNNPACRYVTETQHSLCSGFRAYWEAYGGLPIYGYPISEEFTDPTTGLSVQYFERARFEWNPGVAPARFDVLLGRLGAEDLAVRH